MTSSEEKHMSSNENNDDHGKWTYHEYVTNGQHGYIISGGLLPDDDAVNRKARELGRDMTARDRCWVRTEKMDVCTVRYFYSSGTISDELIEDESKAIGPFYDLYGHNYLIHARLAGGFTFMLTFTLFALIAFGLKDLVIVVVGFMIGAMLGLVALATVIDNPGRRIVDGMGAAISDAKGTPARVRVSSAIRRVLRRCHVRVGATPDDWDRVVRSGGVAYIHENAGMPTFVSRDDAIDLVLKQVRDFGLIPASASHLITAKQLKEPSASTVVGALQNFIEPSAIPSVVSTLNAEQSRTVMARLRSRVPER